jgi:hypothetical protein
MGTRGGEMATKTLTELVQTKDTDSDRWSQSLYARLKSKKVEEDPIVLISDWLTHFYTNVVKHETNIDGSASRMELEFDNGSITLFGMVRMDLKPTEQITEEALAYAGKALADSMLDFGANQLLEGQNVTQVNE